MVKDIINGTFQQTNLENEPEEYLEKRDELRLAEIELMRQRERVAELRRKLPPRDASRCRRSAGGSSPPAAASRARACRARP